MKHFRTFSIVACLIALAAILLMAMNQKPAPQPETSSVDAKETSSLSPANSSETVTSEHPVAEADSNETSTFKTVEIGERGPVAFKVTKRGDKESMKIHVGGFDLNETPDGWIPHLEGSDGIIASDTKGVPELPRIVRYFPGRDGFTADATVTETDWVDVNDVDLAPAESLYLKDDGENWSADRRPDDFLFSQDAFWPRDLVDVQEIRMRDRHVVRVEVRPLQYNPVTGVIRHHKDISADLGFVEKSEKTQAFRLSSSATEVPDNCDCSERYTKELDLFPEINGEASDFASRWPGADSGACVKIRIASQGIWRLTRNILVGAGVSPSDLVGSQIRMFTRDREIPIYVSSQGTFGTSDFIEFYGEGFEGFHADQNAYWLGFGGPGVPARFDNNVVADSSFRAPTLSGATAAQSACRQVTFNPKIRWQGNLNVRALANRPPYHLEYDGYFAAQLRKFTGTMDTITHTFTGTDSVASPANPRMRVAVNGFANISHDLRVRNTANGVSNASNPLSFSGDEDAYEQIEKPLPGNILSGSSTTLEFAAGTPTDDWFYLDWAKLQFDRRLVATGNQLAFGGQTGSFNYDVSGFTAGGRSYILDITDPTNPLKLNATTSGSRVRFGRDLPYDACYFVAGTSAIRPVPNSAVTIENIQNLADERRQADYIVIVPEAFNNNTTYDLLAYRAEQLYRDEDRNTDRRMNVLVATTSSIYNEFGWGIESADAIKQFLGFAYHHFQDPKPKYVVLAGDATRDPLKKTNEYQVGGWNDYVPAKFSGTSFIYTSIDQWFGAVDGPDNCADMVIGRLPVNNATELQTTFNKMRAYEAYTPASTGWRRNVALIADKPENGCAAGNVNTCYNDLNNSIASLPNQQNMTFTRGYKDAGQSFTQVNTIIRNAFNNGAFFINYYGHGALDQWGKEPGAQFWTQDFLNSLNNTRYPLVTTFTCTFGTFTSPDNKDCGAEQLVRRNSGAAGVIAPSGQSLTIVTRAFGLQFYESMFNNVALRNIKTDLVGGSSELTTINKEMPRIGDCLLESYLATGILNGLQTQELRFMTVFMDPAMHHNRTRSPRIDAP